MSPDLDTIVAVAEAARAGYGALTVPVSVPELPGGIAGTVALLALRRLFLCWGLDPAHAGTPSWNPLSDLVPPGARVVIKPNWVMHRNESGQGLDCLITHTSVIEAVLHYLVKARPGRVVLGDAPLQGCDFSALRRDMGLDGLVARFTGMGLDLSLCDFRRTVLLGNRLGARQIEDFRGPDHYVRFDLQEDSLLEALWQDAGRFRVTMYHPAGLQRTHGKGRHQYLIAREVVEADVIVNLAKLKTHRKACLTGALKNLVGVNGNKEYLPHHRKGGEQSGGDCYAGGSFLKGLAEDLLDAANRCGAGAKKALYARLAMQVLRAAALFGHDRNIEGSWHGNDTVWRTCLDLQRIVAYGRPDGTLSPTPQRRIVSITDAIVGGQGEGPLCSTPAASGFLTGATNPAAADWVHARLMGFDPRRIPLVREAFAGGPRPLCSFAPSLIRVHSFTDGMAAEGPPFTECPAEQVRPFPGPGRSFSPAAGWRGHCELRDMGDPVHDTRTRQPALLAQVPFTGRAPHP